MKSKLVFRVLFLERRVDGLRQRCFWVIPRYVRDAMLGELAERLKKLIFIHAGRAGADNAHDVPALFDDLAPQHDGIVESAHEKRKSALADFALETSTAKSLAAGS